MHLGEGLGAFWQLFPVLQLEALIISNYPLISAHSKASAGQRAGTGP